MKTINVTRHSKNISVDKAWKLLTDIEKYPERVKFVKEVKLYGHGEGSQWDDVTTILWVPIRIRHKITALKKNKEYSFEIPLQFGGFMKQTYKLETKSDNEIFLIGSISYDLGNLLLNSTIGPILNRRLKSMLITSIDKVKEGADFNN